MKRKRSKTAEEWADKYIGTTMPHPITGCFGTVVDFRIVGVHVFFTCTYLGCQFQRARKLPKYLRPVEEKRKLHPQLQRKNDAAEIDEFLDDLRAVYLKHNLIVDACGCCDSPFIVRPKSGGILNALAHLVSDYIPDAVEK